MQKAHHIFANTRYFTPSTVWTFSSFTFTPSSRSTGMQAISLSYTLHAVQVVNMKIANGVFVITVHVNQCLEAILPAAVKKPINWVLAGTSDRLDLAMILEVPYAALCNKKEAVHSTKPLFFYFA